MRASSTKFRVPKSTASSSSASQDNDDEANDDEEEKEVKEADPTSATATLPSSTSKTPHPNVSMGYAIVRMLRMGSGSNTIRAKVVFERLIEN